MHQRKSISKVVTFLLLLLMTTSAMAAQKPILVETDKGKICGVEEDGMLSFLGIPYAKYNGPGI